ncbi:MAG: hypothetical protein M3P06_12690 [Acidobacteriota bacterium]|nr:hypothetical protein [Acidobacteriota bacterium]
MQPPATPPPPKPLVLAAPSAPQKRGLSFRAILWIALLLLFAFGLGYVPKELERRRLTESAHAAQLDLRLATLHRQLGVASHEAQRSNFANAANAARAFFEGCRTVVHEYPMEDQPRTRLALQAYAASSDKILGQLANADPAVKEELASLYLTMDGVLARKQ